MLRTNDGKLAILDFGLMTEITDDQKYGMVGKSGQILEKLFSKSPTSLAPEQRPLCT